MRYPLIFLLLVYVLAGCQPEVTEAKQAASKTQMTIESGVLKQAQTQQLGTYFGRVEPRQGALERPDVPVEGARLIKWLVKPGQHIKAGQPIAALSATQWVSLQTQRQTARAELNAQSKLLETIKQRHKQGLTDGYTLQTHQSKVDILKARQQALARQIKQRRDSSLSQQKGQSLWLSTQNGVVQALECTKGQILSASARCIQILDLKRLEVVSWLTAEQLEQVKAIREGIFISSTGRMYPVKLRMMDPTVDEKTHMIATRWAFSQANVPLSGMSGRLKLSQRAIEGLYEIKTLAVTSLEGKDVIFVKKQARWRPHAVEVVRELGQSVIIRVANITEDQQIAKSHIYELKSRWLTQAQPKEQ